MIRIKIAAILLALTMPAAAQVAGHIADSAIPIGPTLKKAVTVTDAIVRIGDLVDHAGVSANIAIFRAPDLGDTGNVPVQRVVEALRQHHLVALDTRGLSDVSVTRVSRSISVKDIESRILRALGGHYSFTNPANISLTFDRELRSLHVEPSATADIHIARLSFDPRNGRFDITLDLPGSEILRRAPLRVTGQAIELHEMIVLARSVNRGEVLRATDLVTERRPKGEIANDAMTDPRAAIGQAARRALRAGLPLRQSDVTKPELVQRNEPVVIFYEAPGLRLTLRGKALESGSEGDTISILNIQSKRTVQGVVSGPGRVTMSSITPHATANLAPIVNDASRRSE